ncbi:MAG: hypothetical protein ACNI27_07180 [Desulfovibrio sp.]
MNDGLLYFEHGEVRLGGSLIDGILSSARVGAQVRFDEAEQDGKSGKARIPMGWEDADVALSLVLLTDDRATCYERLARIDRVFKGYDNSGNPKIFDVQNAHCAARGIQQVVFSGLSSTESERDDTITVSLTFSEHIPVIRKVETQASATAKSVQQEAVSVPDPAPELSLMAGR